MKITSCLLRIWILVMSVIHVILHCECHQVQSCNDGDNSQAQGAGCNAGGVVLRGHMLPLGYHQQEEGHVETIPGFINPVELFDNYMSRGVPVLFKGAAKSLPALQKWNDEYLKEHFGQLKVVAEVGKKENDSMYVYKPSFREFLTEYTTEDIYMVQDIFPAMFGDLGMPRPIQCGGAQNLVQSFMMWMSAGGTKSNLHIDDVENINCLLDGTKTFILIDRKHHDLVEADGFHKSYSDLDVEKVDLLKFPRMGHVPWWLAEMDAGDCLYIPFGWYHHVKSPASRRNLAVNYWFYHLFWFNDTDCDNVGPLDEFSPLKVGMVTGDQREEMARFPLFFKYSDGDAVTLADIQQDWSSFLESHEIETAFNKFDNNDDNVLNWEEVQRADVGWMLKEFSLKQKDTWKARFYRYQPQDLIRNEL